MAKLCATGKIYYLIAFTLNPLDKRNGKISVNIQELILECYFYWDLLHALSKCVLSSCLLSGCVSLCGSHKIFK